MNRNVVFLIENEINDEYWKGRCNIVGAISLFFNIAGAIAPVLNTPLISTKCLFSLFLFQSSFLVISIYQEFQYFNGALWISCNNDRTLMPPTDNWHKFIWILVPPVTQIQKWPHGFKFVVELEREKWFSKPN